MDRRRWLGALAGGERCAGRRLARGGGTAAGELGVDKALSRMSLAGPVVSRCCMI